MPIPAFRDDGYLPNGLHVADEEEIGSRFAQPTERRQYLMGRVRRWISLAQSTGAYRLLIDGSFVTTKAEPGDVDAVVWLPDDFQEKLTAGRPDAAVLQRMLRTREPEALFAAYSHDTWRGWVEFFGRTREPDGRMKGIIEVKL